MYLTKWRDIIEDTEIFMEKKKSINRERILNVYFNGRMKYLNNILRNSYTEWHNS